MSETGRKRGIRGGAGPVAIAAVAVLLILALLSMAACGERAPAVFEWQARLWNARGGELPDELASGIPDDLHDFFRDASKTYLPYLNANARAWQQRADVLDFDIEGVRYRDVPVSQYRVWCLEELQRHFQELPTEAQRAAQALMEEAGAWAPFTEIEEPRSAYNLDGRVPFAGKKVHYDND